MSSTNPMLLAQLLTWEGLMPFAVFGAIAAVAWLILDLIASSKPRAEERLEELRNPRARGRDQDGQSVKKSENLTNMLAKASPAFAKPLQPKTEAEVGKLKGKL